MADEKDATAAPDPGAAKAAQEKDAATPAPGAVHTPGPPVPTPPMTAATPRAAPRPPPLPARTRWRPPPSRRHRPATRARRGRGSAATAGTPRPAKAARERPSPRRPRKAAASSRRTLHEVVAARGLGGLLRRLRLEPGGHRALPLPQRALRAAAVLQGRLPRRVQRGRGGHALEGRLRGVDRARARRLLRAHRGLHPPGLLAQLAARREQVQVPLPRQRLLQDAASTSRARPRARWSARASCSPTTARSWSTSR